MGTLKKNPLFSLIVGVGVMAFIAGVVLAILQMGKASKAKTIARSAQQQLESLVNADPAPSTFNLDASKANVEALRSDLEEIRDELERGSKVSASSDGVQVMAAIQQYITEYSSKTSNHLNEKGEPDPIATPSNFAFGFSRYIGEVVVPDNEAVIPLLDKQRQILSYLIDTLITADPEGIDFVKREYVEAKPGEAEQGGRDNEQSTFRIPSEVSARVPDAIDTMAFRISFRGYTQSLRVFLNALSEFELPIVVRSVEVDRLKTSETAQTRPTNTLDSLFGGFGGGDNSASQPAPAEKPIITDNLSKFTVTLEFIEILIPAENAENTI